MSAIVIRFECGHRQPVDAKVTSAPICHCGERRIARTFAPAPRFTGVVLSGGCGSPAPLAAVAVDAAPAGPLPMKAKD